MHYLIDMGDGETYAVCNFGTVRWISDKPLRFNVVAYAGFNDEDVNVYANGKALAPDATGIIPCKSWNPVEIWYTLFLSLPNKTGSIFI